MTSERLEVWLEPETIAELRRDAAARGVSPGELAREAIEAFVDVERAAVLDPADLDDEVDEELEDDEWSGLERESWSLDDAEES
jgi:Ribbon-helix-helix protein, copG family